MSFQRFDHREPVLRLYVLASVLFLDPSGSLLRPAQAIGLLDESCPFARGVNPRLTSQVSNPTKCWSRSENVNLSMVFAGVQLALPGAC